MLRIKEAREARGWTQERLASEMNTTQQTIQRWETGQTDPKASAIKEISRILGITVSFIMNVNDKEESDEISTLTTDERNLIEYFRKMSKEHQSVTLGTSRGLAALNDPDSTWVNKDGEIHTLRELKGMK